MPIKITDLDGGIGILIRASGEISGQEYVNAHLRHLFHDAEKLRKIKYTLSDWTRVTQHGITGDDIKIVARFCRDASRVLTDTIVAIVVSLDNHYELAKMFQRLATDTGWEIKVFRSSDEARDWIIKRAHEKYGLEDLTLEAGVE